MTTDQKIYTLATNSEGGFRIPDDFIARVAERGEAANPDDDQLLAVTCMEAIAEFMTTFEVKKQ